MPYQGLKALRFHDLTPYRVREVLLVSSPYDAFILEEDGQLTEQVFFEYKEVSASAPPRFTHVPTGDAALEALAVQKFDLILTMTSLAGMGVNDFGRKVKQLRPGRPVVLLALDPRELDDAQNLIDPSAIDGAFLWTGDAQILFAIIKYIEDLDNVDNDIKHGNVRVIIMLEDSPRYYSSFIGVLYKELMSQSRSLAFEGVNELHRRMYMRSRPKILHATSFEKGMDIYERYQSNIAAIISDVRIPRDGKLDGHAGLDFVRMARKDTPDLPVLLHSAEPANAELAKDLGAAFVDKNSPKLLAEIRRFLTNKLGFGEFIFRLPDGREVDRAIDLRQMEKVLERVPESSIAYHAANNDFSVWLRARSEFELAQRLRLKKVTDFPSVDATRKFLIGILRQARQSTHLGVIADFNRERLEQDVLSRIDKGPLGGKARGIAFLNRILADTDEREFGGLEVKIPKTIVITADRFDAFLDSNNLRDFASNCDDDLELTQRFLGCELSDSLSSDLAFLVERLDVPLAIRSSSMLEDALHQPFAGIYSTFMIPNNSPDLANRLAEISNAIKLVYASTFCRNAKSYLQSTGHRIEEERMAVIIQAIVGQERGNRFYPSFSGVAQSFNFYPVGPQKPSDGIVHIALGLGRTVVDGGLALRFSPKHPAVLPQFSSPKSMLDSNQRNFYAVDMDSTCCEADSDLYTNVRQYDLVDAEVDGTLAPIGSVFSADDQQIRDDLRTVGPRVITFNNILKHNAIPLAKALRRLLSLTKKGFGGPVEIEFACDMGDWGLNPPPGQERIKPILYALQVRPFGARNIAPELAHLDFSTEDTLCVSSRSLGHGIQKDVHDIVYVRSEGWAASQNGAIADEIGQLNAILRKENRPYVLIGPGRWGTADESLGIPVQWKQISNAKVIIEASPSGYDVEPSQGTHFFQNITSLRIGYFTLPPGAEKPAESTGDYLDREWLDDQTACSVSKHLRHLRFEEPLTVLLNGKIGSGRIGKPGATGFRQDQTPK